MVFVPAILFFLAVFNFNFIKTSFSFWLYGENKTVSSQTLISEAQAPSSQSIQPLDPANSTASNQQPLFGNKADLIIPSLGVKAPIVFGIGTDAGQLYQRLSDGVVHYSDTPMPGQKGAAVVLGHSSAYPWYKGDYGAVFALLGRLTPGDKVYVHYDNGEILTFTVKQNLIFMPFADDQRLSEIEKTDKQILVLVSCWPVGTNAKRIATVAELE